MEDSSLPEVHGGDHRLGALPWMQVTCRGAPQRTGRQTLPCLHINPVDHDQRRLANGRPCALPVQRPPHWHPPPHLSLTCKGQSCVCCCLVLDPSSHEAHLPLLRTCSWHLHAQVALFPVNSGGEDSLEVVLTLPPSLLGSCCPGYICPFPRPLYPGWSIITNSLPPLSFQKRSLPCILGT